MQVATVMTRDVKSCVPADSLDRPAHLMLAHDTGCVPVVDGEGRAVGLITDRDLCMASFVSGRPLHELSVERTITGRLHAVREDQDVASAHATMRDHAVRRLPVVDADGKLVGMLSLADLVQAMPFVSAKAARNKALEQVLGTLQSVTTPRDVDLAQRYAAVAAKPKGRRAPATKSAAPTKTRKTKTTKKAEATKTSGRKTTKKAGRKTAGKATKKKTARKTARKVTKKKTARKTAGRSTTKAAG